MKYILKTLYPLVVIAVFFGVLLGVAFQLLNPYIIATEKREEEKALKIAIDNAYEYKVNELDGENYYTALDEDGELTGYIFKKGAIGYGGAVVTLIGIKTDGVVNAIVIIKADWETPGLGYKAVERDWQDQFGGLKEDQVPSSKAEYKTYGLEAITGATITSLAVTKNIKMAYVLYNKVSSIKLGGKNGN